MDSYIIPVMRLPRKAKTLLEKMARIEQMERGKLCRMKGRPHYNLQSWQNGRNVVYYVPREQVDAVQKAIEGYETFQKLAQQYADIIIANTRRQRKRSATQRQSVPSPKPHGKKSP